MIRRDYRGMIWSALFFVLTALLQTVAVPEIFGIRPQLIIPAAVVYALFAGERKGAAAALALGLVVDAVGGRYSFGNAVMLMFAAYFSAIAVQVLMRRTFFTALLLVSLSAAARSFVSLFSGIALWPSYDLALAAVRVSLPEIAMTVALTPLFYFPVRHFARRLES